MALTWYGSQSSAETWDFGPLAVVWPLLERMQVAEIINRHLPPDPQAEFDHGTVLTLLAAARLYDPVALVNVAGWAAESGADILWGTPVEKLTDDRLKGKRWKGKRCHEPLFWDSLWGRPWGRKTDSRRKRFVTPSTHLSLP
jgi:hypothetical protein